MLTLALTLLTYATLVLATHPLHSPLFPRQTTCSASNKPCGTGCIPQTGTCCETYYCFSGRACDGAGGCACLATEQSCGTSCMPGDAVCCPDGRYCDAGEFCAPVEGFCCRNGEDPATCAVRQDFTLPASDATTTETGTTTAGAETTTAVETTTEAETTAEVTSSIILTTANSSSVAVSVTGTSTAPVAEFTGAASKRGTVLEVVLGAMGLLAAL